MVKNLGRFKCTDAYGTGPIPVRLRTHDAAVGSGRPLDEFADRIGPENDREAVEAAEDASLRNLTRDHGGYRSRQGPGGESRRSLP
jgi:hypothetical protein